MERILNQDEIDALLRDARHSSESGATNHAMAGHPVPYVFTREGGLAPQQLGSLNQLHETFAREVTQRISASLSAHFELTFASVEQLSFAEFLQQIPKQSYVASMRVQPIETMGLLVLDLPTTWPVIDLLMGGDGQTQPSSRDLSEIEELILRNVVQVIIQELENVWKHLLDVKFGFDERQSQQEAVRMLPPTEIVLAIHHEVHILENRGALMFCFPASVSTALLRRLAHQSVSRKRQVPAESLAARRRQVEACRFGVEMKLPEVSLDAHELLDLRPGRTVVLEHRVEDPVLITVAGRPMYTAYPVRVGSMRAGIIENRLPSTIESAKEML